MSLDDVARITKIQPRILERLEAGKLDGLPADVFVRGFVRSFARCVGLDETEALRRYAACALGSQDLTPTVRALVDAMADLAPGSASAVRPTPRSITAVEVIDAAAPAAAAFADADRAPNPSPGGPAAHAASEAAAEAAVVSCEAAPCDAAPVWPGIAPLAGVVPAWPEAAPLTEAMADTALSSDSAISPEIAPAAVQSLAVAAVSARAAAESLPPSQEPGSSERPASSAGTGIVHASAPADASATDASATDASATDAPAIDASATDAFAIDASATDASATDAPAIDAPATDAPATDAPRRRAATVRPATVRPATVRPATVRPSTVRPATVRPASVSDAAFEPAPRWSTRMPSIAGSAAPWRRPAYLATALPAAPSLVIDDADPESAERVLEERAEHQGAPRRSFLPPILLDREDRSARQGGLTLAVILLLIAATLTLSYLMRRPGASGDGMTVREAPARMG